MRKPNPFLHMLSWGTFGGLFLGALYGISLLLMIAISDGTDFIRELGALFGFGGIYGAMFGGVPGFVLGFIDGIALWVLLKDVSLPLALDDLLRYQKRAQILIGGLTFFGVYAIASVMFGIFALSLMIVIFPSIIATFAAVVVTRRYFVRLAPHAVKGKRKEKPNASTA